jgi:indolepyruvate ferredoxin oxidoreductase beta subunit
MKDGAISVVISGVGGQGVLLTSELLGNAGMIAGLDVRVTETHGLSQRGGSLVSFVRLGKEVHSPLVDQGMADYIISMEMLEGYKSAVFGNPHTLHVVSTLEVPPVTVLSGKAKYPSENEMRSHIETSCERAFFVDAAGMALAAGKSLYQNVVLLGFFAGITGQLMDERPYAEALEQLLPEKSLGANLRAFDLGFKAARKELEHATAP